MSIPDSSIKKLWDQTAKKYSTFDASYYPARLKLELLKKYSTRSSICLDIGIANGIFSIPLSGFVQSIDGIDISDEMLDVCKNEFLKYSITNINLYKRSAEDLQFENARFDLIFSYATLAVVPNIKKALFEIERTLKPGGYAILDFTGKNNLSRIHWGKYYKSIGHFGLNSFSLGELNQLIQALGFEMIENHSIGLLDQWKYIPGINKIKSIEKITHEANAIPDFDYRCSQLIPRLANHWFAVLKKKLPIENPPKNIPHQ